MLRNKSLQKKSARFMLLAAQKDSTASIVAGVGMDAVGLMEDARDWIACSKFMCFTSGGILEYKIRMRYLFWVKKKRPPPLSVGGSLLHTRILLVFCNFSKFLVNQ